MKFRRPFPTTASLGIVLLFCTPARADKTDFLLQGTVKKSDGSAIAGAEVVASPLTEARGLRKGKTRDDGSFKIPFVEYGRYRFTASAEGLLVRSIAVHVRLGNVAESERVAELGDDEQLPEFTIEPGRVVVVDFVMAPKDELSKSSSIPTQGKAWLAEANRLTNEGKYAESDKLLRKALETDEGNGAAYYLLGLNALRSGRREEAASLLQKAEELSPSQPGIAAQLGTLAYESGDKEKAAVWYRKELEVSPDASPVAINLAVTLQDLGRREEAAAAWEKVIAMAPSEAGAYLELASLYADMGKEDKAAEVLGRSEHVGKPDPARWFNLGVNYANSERLDKAEAAYRKCLEIDPSFPEANREMGYLVMRRGETDAALGYFRTYLKLKPDAKDAAEVRSAIEALTPGDGPPKNPPR